MRWSRKKRQIDTNVGLQSPGDGMIERAEPVSEEFEVPVFNEPAREGFEDPIVAFEDPIVAKDE